MAFPTSLNSFVSGNTIPSSWANALETKIGIDNSLVITSLDYLVKNTSSSNPGHKHTLANGATDVTASAAELNYVVGVTSAIQTQLGNKQPLDTALTNISALAYVSASFIKLTADDTYAVRTIAETKSDLSLNLVENTALSTWIGTTNITTLGTIGIGIWNATAIADGKIASALTGKTYNALTLVAAATGFTIAGGTTSKTLTVPLDASVSGTNTGDQSLSDYQTILTNSAGLLAALSDETGTGLAVFNTDPTFVTRIRLNHSDATNALDIGGGATGTNSTFVGYRAGYSNTTGVANTAFGYDTLLFNETGECNTVVGCGGLRSNTGSYNTAVGMNTLRYNIGSYNTAFGHWAMQDNVKGNCNIVVGGAALTFNVAADNNSILGYRALYNDTTGGDNTAMGYNVLYNLQPTSKAITAFADAGGGQLTVTSASHGQSNGTTVQIFNTTSYDGSYIIANVAANTFEITKAFVATETGWWGILSEGIRNVAVGYKAGYSVITGSSNVFLGHFAGAYELGSNAFYVDNQNRTNTAGDKAKALLYGVFNATASSQTLITNSAFTATYGMNIPTGQTYKINGTTLAVADITGAAPLASPTFTGTVTIPTGAVIPNITLGADFTLTQNSVIPFTSVNAGAVVNTLYLKEGNVGIGTTSPLAALDVRGNGVIFIGNVGGNAQMSIGANIISSPAYGSVRFTSRIDAENSILLSATKTLTWTTGKIDSSGNVGIGTATPTANLQVAQPTAGVGTVTITTNTTCTGTGTQFLNTFKVGDNIIITATAETRAISVITSNTVMTIASATNTAGSAYTLVGGTRFSVYGNGNVNIPTLTASEILITDASKNIVSAPVATYPSLAELVYVKGVTSAIQTQLGTKAPLADPTFTGTVGAAAITATADIKANTNNFVVEGSTARSVLRSVFLNITPGATPNTNINCSAFTTVAYGSYNSPTSTNATNLAKSGTSGSWSLDASGTVLSLNFTESVIGIMGLSFEWAKWNTAEAVPYYIQAVIATGNIDFYITKVGSTTALDWTAVMDANDNMAFLFSCITST